MTVPSDAKIKLKVWDLSTDRGWWTGPLTFLDFLESDALACIDLARVLIGIGEPNELMSNLDKQKNLVGLHISGYNLSHVPESVRNNINRQVANSPTVGSITFIPFRAKATITSSVLRNGTSGCTPCCYSGCAFQIYGIVYEKENDLKISRARILVVAPKFALTGTKSVKRWSRIRNIFTIAKTLAYSRSSVIFTISMFAFCDHTRYSARCGGPTFQPTSDHFNIER